jgi:hypothetical protein
MAVARIRQNHASFRTALTLWCVTTTVFNVPACSDAVFFSIQMLLAGSNARAVQKQFIRNMLLQTR